MTRLPDPRERPWLTVAELAAVAGEGEKAIRAACEAGQLPVLRIGRYVRIPTAALLRQLGIDETADSEDDEPGTGSPSASIHVLTAAKQGDPHAGPRPTG